MPVSLRSIEIENFKSFKEYFVIGPLHRFTAVIGPNVSGKSDFIDAIRFVMGEKTSSLRVKRFCELIHGASIGQPVKRSASVTAVFELEDGSEKSFMRSVQGSSSEHRINNSVVTSQVYLNELEHLGINVKAKNFLVFQGAVESIAMKNPKQITALFEEISNSGALKAKYDRLKSEKLLAEEQAMSMLLYNMEVAGAKKKRVKARNRLIKQREYLEEDCVKKQVELQLFKLFHNEKETENLGVARRKKQIEINQAIQVKKETEYTLREHISKFDELGPELLQIDSEVKDMETEMSWKMDAATEANEKVAHMCEKVEVSQKNFTAAQTAEEAHRRDIKQLEDELEVVRKAKEDYEIEVAGLSQSQGRDMQLEDEQPPLNAIESSMASMNGQIDNIRANIYSSEDEVFVSFVSQIGVPNIREYEEGGLRLHHEREKERMKFNDQIDRIQNLLAFERNRDNEITGNVRRWRESLEAAEEGREAAQRSKVRQLTRKEQVGIRMNELLAAQTSKRNVANQKEEEIERIRREVGVIGRRILALRRQLTSIEAKIDQNKAERHNILMQCKIEDIPIPLLAGNIEGIARGSVTESETASDTSSITRQYERESLINVDYSSLPEYLKELDEDGIRKMTQDMNSAIKELHDAMVDLQSSKLNETQWLRSAGERGREAEAELKALRNKARILRTKFDKVMLERQERFQACFEHVKNVIDKIYKILAKDQSAWAFLELETPEEPYLGGINYNCIAPGKRFQPMSNLSGGEKTVAALALLFAVHSFQPAPFFVLDEIDAALDNTNIDEVARYIRHEITSSQQTIVISSKAGIYSYADTLIGINDADGECLETMSEVIIFNMTEYPSD